MNDSFRGDNAQLVSSISALLDLDAEGALVPHGVGGHARTLLSAAAARLAALTPQAPQPEAATPEESSAVVAAEPVKPLDDPRLQEMFSAAIDGALTLGFQGVSPAPAGHWLEFWWKKGRAVAEVAEPVPAPVQPAGHHLVDPTERSDQSVQRAAGGGAVQPVADVEYGRTDFGYELFGIDVPVEGKRLMAMIVMALGNRHPAVDDLMKLLLLASRPAAADREKQP